MSSQKNLLHTSDLPKFRPKIPDPFFKYNLNHLLLKTSPLMKTSNTRNRKKRELRLLVKFC